MDKLAALLKTLLQLKINTFTKLVGIKAIDELGEDVHAGMVSRLMGVNVSNATIKKSLDVMVESGLISRHNGRIKKSNKTAHMYKLSPIAQEIADNVGSVKELMEIRKLSTSIHQALVTHCLQINGPMTRPEIADWTKYAVKDTARLAVSGGRCSVNRVHTHKSIYTLTNDGIKYARLIQKLGQGVLV